MCTEQCVCLLALLGGLLLILLLLLLSHHQCTTLRSSSSGRDASNGGGVSTNCVKPSSSAAPGSAPPVKSELDALRQQATIGPCNKPRPGMWDSAEDKARYEAWKKLDTMPKAEAMHLYVQAIEVFDEDWLSWDGLQSDPIVQAFAPPPTPQNGKGDAEADVVHAAVPDRDITDKCRFGSVKLRAIFRPPLPLTRKTPDQISSLLHLVARLLRACAFRKASKSTKKRPPAS